MPTGRAPTRQSPDATAGGRLHIHGIKEMPAGYDAEVAELFRDFRAASNLSEGDLAARLSTRIEVVQALEQGALYALPPWAETCRVVNNYGLLLNLDVRPLLRRIYAQVEAGIVELRPKPMPEVPFMTPPETGGAEFPMGFGAPMAPRPAPYQPPPPPRPNVAPRPAAPPAAPDRRAQPRPAQARAPQTQSPQPKPRPAPAPAPVTEKRRRPALKWGIVALLVLGMGFGIWMLLDEPNLFGSATSQTGSKASPSDKPLDPQDPRNRKADRLPSPNGF